MITFGMHDIHNELLHVRAIRDETQFVQYLRDATSGTFPNEQSQHDGTRFLKVVMSRYFDMRGYSYQAPDCFEDEAMDNASACLMRNVAVARKVIAVR